MAGAVSQDLYASSADTVPDTVDDSCRKIATMHLDLIRAAERRRKDLMDQNDGRAPRVIDVPVRIEFHPGSDKNVLEVSAKANTQTRVGAVRIEYVCDPKVRPPKALRMPSKKTKLEE